MGLWRPLGKFQLGSVEIGQVGEVAVIERSVEVEHLPVVEIQFAREDIADPLGCAGLDLEPDGGGETPFLDDFLDHLDQVLGDLLVASNLGVTGHPEEGGVDDFDVREEQIEVRPDDVLQEDVPGVVAELDEPELVARDLHARRSVPRRVVPASIPRARGSDSR